MVSKGKLVFELLEVYGFLLSQNSFISEFCASGPYTHQRVCLDWQERSNLLGRKHMHVSPSSLLSEPETLAERGYA